MVKQCENGHTFKRKGNCEVCPICENERKPSTGFMSAMPAPARRALEQRGWTDLEILSKQHYSEVAQLHGMGPKALGIILEWMKQSNMNFTA